MVSTAPTKAAKIKTANKAPAEAYSLAYQKEVLNKWNVLKEGQMWTVTIKQNIIRPNIIVKDNNDKKIKTNTIEVEKYGRLYNLLDDIFGDAKEYNQFLNDVDEDQRIRKLIELVESPNQITKKNRDVRMKKLRDPLSLDIFRKIMTDSEIKSKKEDVEFKRDHNYDDEGYDMEGYDEEGYDAEGYNKHGYNRAGKDKDGYNLVGKDDHGFTRAQQQQQQLSAVIPTGVMPGQQEHSNTDAILKEVRSVYEKSVEGNERIAAILNQLETSRDGDLQKQLQELQMERSKSQQLVQEVQNFKDKLLSGGLRVIANKQGELVIKNTHQSVIDAIYPSSDEDVYGKHGDDADKTKEIMQLINTLMENIKKVRQLKSEGRWD